MMYHEIMQSFKLGHCEKGNLDAKTAFWQFQL